jgi:hypothetical protein
VATFRCTGWQHNFALGGRITLHCVAEIDCIQQAAGFRCDQASPALLRQLPTAGLAGFITILSASHVDAASTPTPEIYLILDQIFLGNMQKNLFPLRHAHILRAAPA